MSSFISNLNIDMKKIFYILIIFTFAIAGCSKSTLNDDDDNDYIKSPSLPYKEMTWGMCRPENGGTVPGYVYDSKQSGSGEYYILDVFINESQEKIWGIHYSKTNDAGIIDGNTYLVSMYHRSYSKENADNYYSYLDNLLSKSKLTEVDRGCGWFAYQDEYTYVEVMDLTNTGGPSEKSPCIVVEIARNFD